MQIRSHFLLSLASTTVLAFGCGPSHSAVSLPFLEAGIGKSAIDSSSGNNSGHNTKGIDAANQARHPDAAKKADASGKPHRPDAAHTTKRDAAPGVLPDGGSSTGNEGVIVLLPDASNFPPPPLIDAALSGDDSDAPNSPIDSDIDVGSITG